MNDNNNTAPESITSRLNDAIESGEDKVSAAVRLLRETAEMYPDNRELRQHMYDVVIANLLLGPENA